MSILRPKYSREQKAALMRGFQKAQKFTPAMGGTVSTGAKILMRKELARHSDMLKNVASMRATSIGKSALRRFGKAADAAKRKMRGM